jgi:GT2 family glycosyltransferase
MSIRLPEFSIIIPVYNRPDEIEELLESMASQTNRQFEVVIVEDGSDKKSDVVIGKYEDKLDISYYYKENNGPGASRNYGMDRANGNYYIFLDSDCILPPGYFQTIVDYFSRSYVDAFGGPDSAHEDFSELQKAVNYSMTSFFTTGGIRGGGEKMEKFHPRSFNMGISREVFKKTGGFPQIRFALAKAAGEDMDLSIQIKKHGFTTALIKEAYVYHKRRTSLKQFWRQVSNFGMARISIFQRHPESLKPLHGLPAVFLLGCILLIVLSIFVSPTFLIPVLVYAVLIFLDSTIRNRCIRVGILSVVTSYIQLLGYGYGFIYAIIRLQVLKKDFAQN